MVTVLDADQLEGQGDVGVCEDGPPRSGGEGEEAGSQAGLGGDGRTVEALFVFGGMDTEGTIHSDCFVFVPPTQLH